MQKNQPSDKWPEIVLGTSDTRRSQAISRALKLGLLRKIAPRVYSSNLQDSPADIVKRHRYYLLGQLYPGAVISYRSAIEGGISPEGSIVLTYKYTRTILLPGLTIRLVKGPGPDVDDMPFLENIYIASQGRAYLENMQKSRVRQSVAKTISISDIEERLDRLIRIFGTDEINKLRDQAKGVAFRLGMQDEFSHLDKIISALLGTRSDTHLQSERAKSRALGIPFDPARNELFATLAAHLYNYDLPIRVLRLPTKQAKVNQAFFEAYFSNYIEGTRFAIEEAEKIIFENKIFPHRPADSHDILSTFRIISDDQMARSVPASGDRFLLLLQDRHAMLMQAREEAFPGMFKTVVNRAGSTVFVNPDEVRGTLLKGFEYYQKLKPGIARAIFMMFLIAEVHPFTDGNGRIARLFMNAELTAQEQCRIIIPTVYREDYLLALRKFSRQHDPDAYTRMLLTAQAFTDSISFQDYAHALMQLKAKNAFLEPSEGKLIL